MINAHIIYVGLSTLEKPILSALYAEGWDDVVRSGYYPETTVGQDNDGLHHILAKAGRKHAGILSIWEDESFTPSEARILMLYVKPEYRNRGVAGLLMSAARIWGNANGYGTLSATVHINNRPMREFQEKRKGSLDYVTYQYKLKGKP